MILVLHGPNLNKLGEREPEIYGSTTLEEINRKLVDCANKFQIKLDCFQSNHEGEIIDKIHVSSEKFSLQGIIINAGGYTHTSIAIRDALQTYSQNNEIVEVHISDINQREEFRKINLISDICNKSITGKGVQGYIEALEYINEQ